MDVPLWAWGAVLAVILAMLARILVAITDRTRRGVAQVGYQGGELTLARLGQDLVVKSGEERDVRVQQAIQVSSRVGPGLVTSHSSPPEVATPI